MDKKITDHIMVVMESVEDIKGFLYIGHAPSTHMYTIQSNIILLNVFKIFVDGIDVLN